MNKFYNIFIIVTVCLWFMTVFIGFPIVFIGIICETLPIIFLWYWFLAKIFLTGLCTLNFIYLFKL